jgi:hypothetical protein
MSKPDKKNEQLLTFDEVVRVLEYNSLTGIFTWKVDRDSGFWKGAIKAGTLAGDIQKRTGYHRIMINNIRYFSHRLAWLISTGDFPNEFIDHINGNRSDNRLINLREATKQQNNRNACKRKDNTSGIKGVSWHKASSKWAARIGNKHLGLFVSKEEATAVREEEVKRRFGEFQRE